MNLIDVTDEPGAYLNEKISALQIPESELLLRSDKKKGERDWGISCSSPPQTIKKIQTSETFQRTFASDCPKSARNRNPVLLTMNKIEGQNHSSVLGAYMKLFSLSAERGIQSV